MRSRVLAALAAALAAGVVGVAVASSTPRAGPRGPAGASGTPDHLVLVSGRDDHGLLATPEVMLRDRPVDGTSSGWVPDGTLARVVATKGTWIEVRTVEGPDVHGWVDDFHLRAAVHLVGPAPTCRVPLDGQVLPAGEQATVLEVRDTRARVRVARTGTVGWVERSTVRELPPRPGCGASRPAEPHGHDH